ncbi:MAG: hypothetical protein AABX89_06405 [Candidatus Thermoplasmatota archaeon]
MPSVGQPLPAFSIAAAVSGRPITPALFAKRGVLILHGVKSSDAAKEVSKLVRGRWPQATDVALASIVDLRSFAGLWKKVAEAQIKSTYEKLAAKATEAGLDPAEQVLIGPDWDGSVCATLGATKPDEAPTALVVKSGTVVAVCVGADLTKQVETALS